MTYENSRTRKVPSGFENWTYQMDFSRYRLITYLIDVGIDNKRENANSNDHA